MDGDMDGAGMRLKGNSRSDWFHHRDRGLWEHRKVDAVLYWPQEGGGWSLYYEGVTYAHMGFGIVEAIREATRVIERRDV